MINLERYQKLKQSNLKQVFSQKMNQPQFPKFIPGQPKNSQWTQNKQLLIGKMMLYCFLQQINQSIILNNMQTIFSSCLDDNIGSETNKLDVVIELPLKFKIANSLGLTNLIVKYFAEPRKRQKYTFPRNFLKFIFNENCHIPFLYFPIAYPGLSQIIVYCHGSGSNLNNVYDFAYQIANRYGVAVLAFDYTGDGQSEKEFSSYEQDLSIVLSWVIRQGFCLTRTILCGFSLGSYSASKIEGQMPRILISPVCGILSFFNGEAERFENEKYSTIQNALRLKTKCLVYHCSQEMVHLSHGQLIAQALQRENGEEVIFHEITDQQYEHRTAPSYLFSKIGSKILVDFLENSFKDSKIVAIDQTTKKLKRELLEMIFFETETASLAKFQSVTTL